MQAHIIGFGMVSVGMSWLVRQAGTASRPIAALAALCLVSLQVSSGFLKMCKTVCAPTLALSPDTCKHQVGLHYSSMDQSSNEYVKHYGEMHLAKLPRNAILIVKGDVITNSIRYLQVTSAVCSEHSLHSYLYPHPVVVGLTLPVCAAMRGDATRRAAPRSIHDDLRVVQKQAGERACCCKVV